MNFLKKNWASVTILITFSVLAISLAIHSYYQPLEYDEYREQSDAVDAEYDRLFRESSLIHEQIRDTAIVENLMSMTPEEAAAWRKEAKNGSPKESRGGRKRNDCNAKNRSVQLPHHITNPKFVSTYGFCIRVCLNDR